MTLKETTNWLTAEEIIKVTVGITNALQHQNRNLKKGQKLPPTVEEMGDAYPLYAFGTLFNITEVEKANALALVIKEAYKTAYDEITTIYNNLTDER